MRQQVSLRTLERPLVVNEGPVTFRCNKCALSGVHAVGPLFLPETAYGALGRHMLLKIPS